METISLQKSYERKFSSEKIVRDVADVLVRNGFTGAYIESNNGPNYSAIFEMGSEGAVHLNTSDALMINGNVDRSMVSLIGFDEDTKYYNSLLDDFKGLSKKYSEF